MIILGAALGAMIGLLICVFILEPIIQKPAVRRWLNKHIF